MTTLRCNTAAGPTAKMGQEFASATLTNTAEVLQIPDRIAGSAANWYSVPHSCARLPSQGDPPGGNLALPHTPNRRRQPRLTRCDGVRPNHDLSTVLPLAGYSLMSDLVPAVIHCEVPPDSLRLECDQRFPQLFGIETARPPYGVYQKLTAGIVCGGLIRGRTVELSPILGDGLRVRRRRYWTSGRSSAW
jgi:hypothetical protein